MLARFYLDGHLSRRDQRYNPARYRSGWQRQSHHHRPASAAGPRIFDQTADLDGVRHVERRSAVRQAGDVLGCEPQLGPEQCLPARSRTFSTRASWPRHFGQKACVAVPGCVPFNIFGGQGANGEGSITQEMLDWAMLTQSDERPGVERRHRQRQRRSVRSAGRPVRVRARLRPSSTARSMRQ